MALKSGIGQAEQQRLNRAFVIELLRRKKICSRADLSKASQLKRSTITNIVNEFIEKGLVIEDGLLEGDKGRRSIGVRVNGHRYRVIGVMVTRNYYSIGLIGLSGEIYSVKHCPIRQNSSATIIIDHIKHDIHRIINSAKNAKVLAIGIAMPGPYKREKGEMIFVTNLIGWENVPVYQRLQEGFDIPVFIENDANAGAYAQYWYRDPNVEPNNLAYVVAGQGIGCGVISDGEILRGAIGIAGEIGHTSIHFEGPECECGNRGCLEVYCSAIVLNQNITRRIENHDGHSVLKPGYTNKELEQAIRNNDEVALQEYEKVCNYLAIGMVNMINQINPSLLIIGDQLASFHPEVMLRIVREKVQKTVRPLIWESLQIEINKLEYNPIMIGAGAIAAQNVFVDPLSYIA